MSKKKELPRGIRNNNPGNVERSRDPWQGLRKEQTDPRFFQCETPVDGVRMLARVLLTYHDKRLANDGSKIDTLREIVERWAPAVENNVAAYLRHVEQKTGFDDDETLNFHLYEVMEPVVKAIIAHENENYAYPQEVIDEALRRVGIIKPTSVPAPLNTQNVAVGSASTIIATVGGVSEAWDAVSEKIDPSIIIGLGLVVIFGVLAYTAYQWWKQHKLGVS